MFKIKKKLTPSLFIYRAEPMNKTAGVPVILPSSFIGSPRAMNENYQDSMAIIRKYGKPD